MRHTMRPCITIIILSLTLVFDCSSPDKKIIDTFIEEQPSFYDLRNGDPTKNAWIRNPRNLLTVHETYPLKQFGNNLDKNITLCRCSTR